MPSRACGTQPQRPITTCGRCLAAQRRWSRVQRPSAAGGSSGAQMSVPDGPLSGASRQAAILCADTDCTCMQMTMLFAPWLLQGKQHSCKASQGCARSLLSMSLTRCVVLTSHLLADTSIHKAFTLQEVAENFESSLSDEFKLSGSTGLQNCQYWHSEAGR